MTTSALLERIRLFKGSTNHARWQSFFVGQTVDGYTFAPFETSGVVVNASADQSEMTVTFPLTGVNMTTADRAFTDGWLAQVEIYSFQPLANDQPPSSKTQVADFIGEIIGVELTTTHVRLRLGSALDPVASQIPPRKFTSSLIGTPPKR